MWSEGTVRQGTKYSSSTSGCWLSNCVKFKHVPYLSHLVLAAATTNPCMFTHSIYVKVELSDGVELTKSKKTKDIKTNGYKYLGILEYNKIKES